MQQDFSGQPVAVSVLPHLLNVADGQADDQVHQDDPHLDHEDGEHQKHPETVLERLK